jgi:ATP-dependent DNA ligase
MFTRAKYKDQSVQSWQTLKNPVATLKRDGANFWLTIDDTGGQHYFSRRPSVKGGFPDRTDQLPHLTSTKLPQFAGHVYNVELIHTGHNKANPESHPKVSGILNSKTERSIQTQKETGPVRVVLINVLNPAYGTYRDKLLHMKEVEKAVGKPDVLFVDTPEITKEGIVKLINKTKAEGREGVIITDLNEPEHKNTRIKIKYKNTLNLRVSRLLQEVDIHGTLKNSMGAMELVDGSGRVVGKVGSGFTKEEREQAWREPEKWIGQLIQVTFRNIVREGGMIIQPSYNGIADGELDTVSKYAR